MLCLGHKAEAIKEYFLSYNEALSNDFVLRDGGSDIELLGSDIDDWSITFVNTGLNAADRAAAEDGPALHRGRRVFLATYGDGLTDAPLARDDRDRSTQSDAVGLFLAARTRLTTSTSSRSTARTACATMQDVTRPTSGSTPATSSSGGRSSTTSATGEDLVEEPFQRLIEEEKLIAYPYGGFWAPMDTLKDKHVLESLLGVGSAPWRVARGRETARRTAEAV